MYNTDQERIEYLYNRAKQKEKHISFCLPCQFSFIEKEAFPLIPPDISSALNMEHQILLKAPLSPSAFAGRLTEVFDAEREILKKFLAGDQKGNSILGRVEADQFKCLVDHGIPVSCGSVICDETGGIDTPFSEKLKQTSHFENDYLTFLKHYSRIKLNMQHVTCCLECHFVFEEEQAFQYLPTEIQKKLQAEHDELRDRKFPERELLEHSIREMVYFKHYISPDENDSTLDRITKNGILDRIEVDHLGYYMEKKVPVIYDQFILNTD